MKTQGHSEANHPDSTRRLKRRGSLLVLGGLLLLFAIDSRASTPPRTDTPLIFFTNVAARLLQSELNVDLSRLQVYPTNQYTPSVHRLLQVTANLYDATTNRPATAYPYLPSVFRPLFRRADGGQILIAGYREVQNDILAQPVTAPPMVDLETGANTNLIPQMGTPFGPDGQEPMVWGIPLVIGGKKGFPNFNEFAMQNALQVIRRLRFHRPADSDWVTETNQLYVVSITNVFGVEAWNSYSNAFPRDLEMIVAGDITAMLTNELGAVLVSNQAPLDAALQIPANTWAGHSYMHPSYSFAVPLVTNFVFLPNSTYSPMANEGAGGFVPLTNDLPVPPGGPFYVPHWWLNLKTRLRYSLVDGTNIVDYVDLNHSEPPMDLTAEMLKGASCWQPMDAASVWCINRMWGADPDDATVPTVGMNAQVLIGLGLITPSTWGGFIIDPSIPHGSTMNQAIGAFLYNLLGLKDGDVPGNYIREQDFFAPFVPVLNQFTKVSWQANDPLVHYTLGDLTGPNQIGYVSVLPDIPPLRNLGYVNTRYEPWGGGPPSSSTPTIAHYDPSAKDPLVRRSDDWDFPTNQSLDATWLGRVHRGTPWQTIYLKSPSVALDAWQIWTGAPDAAEAQRLHPTNDWRLASLLASWFSEKDPHTLLSVNEANPAAWMALLDGMAVLTNTTPSSDLLSGLPPQFDMLVISSNLPQATTIAVAIDTTRAGQPGRHFRGVGDILATPELSVASPWLDQSSSILQQAGISDAAYEAIPSQLLPRLRPDSIGSALQSGGMVQIQFSGIDDCRYAVEVSSDLSHWTAVSTNTPANGCFGFSEPPGPSRRFYRSVLLP